MLAARLGPNLAWLVAAGILLSRIAGLVRESVFAHYLGNSDAADAFKAGIRIPNILQNLFGEGVLSASFIPVYSKLLSEGDAETAETLAWGVGALLALGVAILVALGVWATPWLIAVIAPGFTGAKRELTVTLVRILFPGAGLLVLSAWCLGVLNSHHRFFASYTAPVAWNLAIIAALVFYGPRRSQEGLAVDLAWSAVVGAFLQIAVQAPQTLRAGRPPADRFRAHAHGFRHGLSQPHAGRRRARREPDFRLRRQPAREPAADRRGLRAQLREHPLPAADKPVRDVGRGGRVAEHVARGRHLRRRSRSFCGCAWTRACGRSRFSSCLRRRRFCFSATWSRR